MLLDRRYLFVFPLLAVLLRADISLPRVLGDNRVLQREQPVPIWGRAVPGEEVAVRFAGQEKHARADAAGCWQVTLDALATSGRPVAVRFAWRETAQPNLINGAGLPAFPFRTDAPVWSGAKPAATTQTPVAP